MCNHVYTANYKQMPKAMGIQCPYPDLYKKARSASGAAPTLPLDNRGECIFHSREAAWKRENDFQSHVLQLVGMLVADTTAEHYDFAEFVFVGGEPPDGAGPNKFKIAATDFPKMAYFFAASFLDSLVLDHVQFRGGADFRLAIFARDLHATDARFNGFDASRAECQGLVSFTKVEWLSYALFGNARFTGTANVHAVKFEDSQFDGLTDFSDTAFALGDESSAAFLRTRFESSADFSRARFDCRLVFSNVSFAGYTEFVDTSFGIIKSSAQYRASALEFYQIEVMAGGVLRFESTDTLQKLFKSDVQMSFSAPPAGLIRFENVNFKNITPTSRERLTELARLGKVVIGSGCIKYRLQTQVTRIEITEANAPLALNICQTFTNYFTASNGLNLGFEVVERTRTAVHFFYFTDEDISEELFHDRLAATSKHMWSLLSVPHANQLLALEAPAALARPAGKESAVINAVDCVTAMMAIFFSVGIRIVFGKWKEADTRALRRATNFGDEGPESAQALHVVLVDRYSGAALFDLNRQQHAGLILAYRDEPTMETIDFAILTVITVEREAVCAAFGLTDEHRVNKGSRVYWRGKLPLKNGKAYELVVGQAPDAANVDAALLTNDLLRDWKPGAALLVGIAATTDQDKVKLGDVVLASEVYYYERGKVTPGGTKPEPKSILADATLWGRVTTMSKWDGKLPVLRPDNKKTRPIVHTGVIASGEKVIADAEVRDEIAAANRQIIAIEMEGYGFSRAVWQSFEHVKHLDIRVICDDGSPRKDDKWHAYAAAAAAGFAKHFLLDQPLTPRLP